MDLTAALAAKASELALRRGTSREAALRSARRVRRGVYCTDSRPASFEESVVAALLVLPPCSVSAGLTAARLWRLDGLVPVRAEEPMEFLVPGRTNSVKLAGCRLHFTGFTGVDLPQGVPATGKARTILDVVATLPYDDGAVLAEMAVHSDPPLHAALVAEHLRRVPRRGNEVVERVLRFAAGLSEAVLEVRARLLWDDAALPPPRQQAVIRGADGRFVARVDFLWEGVKLIVEVDGLAKYAEPHALGDEKRRQNALIALGYTVLRFTWADIVNRPQHVVAQVRAALRKAS